MNTWLDGKKTLFGGIGIILSAVGYFLSTSLSDGLQINDVLTLLTGVAGGLAVLGLGGKLQKVINALNGLDSKNP